MLRALLDLVILRLLEEHPMSAYEIGEVLTRNFGSRISPSTIYCKLSALQNQKQIHCEKTKSGKSYSLTELGKQTVNDLPLVVEEICESVQILLRSKNGLFKKKEMSNTMTYWKQHTLLKLLQQQSKQPPHATI
ncbi:MAG: PadR family transcriptional regulator [Candidatus Bathyarchaeota archaeon]|nr:PadR family transcriptional regulator [Candidatus Bathyarchaeota archaeon]